MEDEVCAFFQQLPPLPHTCTLPVPHATSGVLLEFEWISILCFRCNDSENATLLGSIVPNESSSFSVQYYVSLELIMNWFA